MNRLGEKIKNYINDRKSKRIYRITAVLLSLVVVFSVATSLILPAISATQFPDIPMETTLYANSSADDFSDFDVSKAFNLQESIGELNFEKSSSDGNTVTGEFSMTYEVNEKDVLSADKPYLYVQLPDNVEIPSDLSGNVVDGSNITGKYIIEKDTGLVKIKIKEEFFENYKNGFSGTLKFESSVTRIDSELGSTSEVKIGNQIVMIDGFTPKKISMAKSGVNNGDGTITWSIVVDNPTGEDLGNFTLSDTMFDNSRADNVKIEPSSAGSYDSSNHNFSFKSGATDKKVTITYTTKLTDDEVYTPNISPWYTDDWHGKIVNSAKLKKDDGSDPIDKEVNVSYDIGYNLSKDGAADYENGTINWKLTITNKYSRPLNDFKIKDTMLSQYFGDDISNITFSPSSVTGTLSGDTITLDSGDYTGDVVITYSTPAEKGVTYKNQAELHNPKDQPIGDKPSKEVSYTPSTFSKSHQEDRENKLINWTINIKNNSGNPETLNGYYVIDEMFKDAVGDIKLQSNNTDLDKKYYTIDKTNGKITFNGFTKDCNINEIKITYSTDPYNGTPNESNTEFTNINTADLYNGSGDKDDSVTDTDKWVSTNSLEKKHGEAKFDEENGIMTIPWTITIEQEAGKFKGFTLKDIVLANDSENVDLHYITPQQLKAITIVDATTSYKPLSSDCYTVTESNANLKSFNIAFNDVEALNDVDKVIITYETTALIGDVETGQTVIFDNKATFNGKESKDPLPYENVDTSKTPYKKYDGSISIDQQTTGTTSKSVGQLEKVTVDGVEYYKFDYIITIDKSKYNDAYTLTDTLPDGFTLCGDVKANWGGYVGTVSANGGNTYYTYDENNGILKFIVNATDCKSLDQLTYSLKVNAKEFDERLKAGSVSVENKLKDDSGKYDEVVQTQKFEESVLTKSLSGKEQAAGYIEYELKLNPEGANLSRDDKLILTDIIKAHTYGNGVPCNDPGGINLYLDSIHVYQMGAGTNGEDVELDSSKYQFVLDNNPEIQGQTEASIDLSGLSDNGNGWYIGGIKGGKYTVSLTSVPNTDIVVYIKEDGTDFTSTTFTTDSSGKGVFEFESTSSKNFTLGMDFYYNNTWNRVPITSIDSIKTTTTGTHPYAAKLTLTVPDETPLRIVYKYLGRRPEGSGKNDSVGVVNSVSVNTAMKTEQSTIDSEFKLTSDSESTITGKEYFNIKKVDVGDYSLRLNAVFNLYKWDGSSWLAAKTLDKEIDDKSGEITNLIKEWGSAEDTPADLNVTKDELYRMHLDNDAVYKIVEKTSPEGYQILKEPRYFTAGILPSGISVPEEAKNYTIVSNGGNLNIQNYKNIEVGVRKIWADGNNSHNDITVKLYKSSVLRKVGFPDDSDLTEISEATLGMSNNWYYKWDNLPSGTDDGKPIYYYVKEELYTEDGKTYTAFYNGNAANSDGIIKITNTAGLTVRKVWHDFEGQDCNPLASEIRFKVFRSTTQSLDGSLPSGAKEWTAGNGYNNGYYTLNSDNNWSMTFASAAPYDDNGNSYYYYVVEDTSNFTDIKVSYVGNGSGSTGLITITNKSTKIVIGHMPETGSIGTVWFFAAGGVLAIGALAALRILRRHLSDQS